METQHWIGVAYDCGYINRKQAIELRDKSQEIGRILGGMMAKASKFSNPEALALRETQAEYFIEN